ncbi:MAG: hypothetical protein C0618_03810 [Desulfuromonas sp.]|nr:MAG: hypothetical protein C0618_03810 [Desulfuromonas sp.]
MECSRQCLRFGELALKMGYITPEQLSTALARQEQDNRSNHHRVLGLILYDEGWMTTTQIEQVLKGVFLLPEADVSVR